MTAHEHVERFVRIHGDGWFAFKREPIFHDFLAMLRAHDPARLTPGIESGAATENAQHLLGRIAGANLIINVIEDGIARAPEPVHIEPSYSEESPLP